MIRRPRRTVPAVLVALVVLALAALVATSSVQTLLGRPPLVPFDAVGGALGEVAWRSGVVRIAGVVVAVVGLLLLLAALVPGRPHVLPLARRGEGDTAESDISESGIHRTDATRLLRSTAQDVAGVERASVDLRRTRARVRATVARADGDRARAELRERLESRLAGLSLARVPRLRLSVTTAKGS